METTKEKEERLYREARALKFQARALRKKRLADEKVQQQIEDDALDALNKKTARDDRIRKAVLAMADACKTNNVAFDAPEGWRYGGGSTETKDAFILIDKTTGDRVQIRTQWNGFQWD